MKKIFRKVLTASLLITVLLTFPVSARAADSVTVTIPEFSITLNDVVIDNSHSEYPFIVYKDITYFPMTYWGTRWLGVNSNWTSETGLMISTETWREPSGVPEYRTNIRETANAGTYTAHIADFPITVNNEVIDNASEEYPLLVFRDVTYFPLTWRFCVNTFGWHYSWSAENGLNIFAGNDWLYATEYHGSYWLAGEKFTCHYDEEVGEYYENSGMVYRWKIGDETYSEVYAYPKVRYNGSLGIENDKLYLFYNTFGLPTDLGQQNGESYRICLNDVIDIE